MRCLLLLAGCLFLLSATGCQDGERTTKAADGVDVIVEGGGEFPSSLAGRWKGEKNWEIVFEADGTILEAKHGIGGSLIKPLHVSTVKDKEKDATSILRAGRWRVHYLPDDRELRVEIVIDSVHLAMGPVVLDGKVTDEFVGPVSEDGKVWEAQWFTFAEYRTPDKDSPVIAPTPQEVFAGVITFKKVEQDE